MNILIIGTDNPHKTIAKFETKDIERIKKAIPGAKITLTDNEEKINKLLPLAEVIIFTAGGVYPLSKLDFGKAKQLKWFHSTSAGVKDMALALRGTEIILTNSSGVHPIPISETVAGYMLMFARSLNKTYRNQILKKRWTRDHETLRGFELAGKTVGIVGAGRIGLEIAHVCKAFGMRVVALVHNKKITNKNVDKKYHDLSKLLAESDFVIDCLPDAPGADDFFGIDEFRGMKKSAYFINIGRGATVVESDLVKALKQNIIAGAALDVFEVEPLPDTSPLWQLDNVILTPHSSSWTPEYTDRVITIFLENYRSWRKNKPMPNLVDTTLGY